MPIREGAQIQEPWDVLLRTQDEHAWRELHDEFGCDPADFKERHYSEFVTFLPYVRDFLYGEGAALGRGAAATESPMRVFRRNDIAKVRLSLPAPAMEAVTLEVAHVDLYFFYDVDIVVSSSRSSP
jgi:hypothetical protein